MRQPLSLLLDSPVDSDRRVESPPNLPDDVAPARRAAERGVPLRRRGVPGPGRALRRLPVGRPARHVFDARPRRDIGFERGRHGSLATDPEASRTRLIGCRSGAPL